MGNNPGSWNPRTYSPDRQVPTSGLLVSGIRLVRNRLGANMFLFPLTAPNRDQTLMPDEKMKKRKEKEK